MKKFLSIITCLLWLAACGSQEPSSPQAGSVFEDAPVGQTSPAAVEKETEAIVAQVGPENITRAQLEHLLQTLDEQDRAFASTPVGEHNFIQLLVREKLAALDAKAKGLDKQEQYLQDLANKRAQLQEVYQNYADQLLLRLWDEQNQAKGAFAVTEEEIAAYFKKYPYEMTIKQIIIDDAQTADTVWRELRHNKNRWKELERRFSIAPQRSYATTLTFMPGEFIPELEVIAANSPTGSVQGFVKTSQGFHIIMKTNERRLSLKDAQPRIRTILENQKKDALLEDLQTNYKVVIYE